MRKLFASETKRFIDQQVTLYGWVRVRRQMGKILFLDLWDRTGLIQVVIVPSLLNEFDKILAKEIRQGFCVEVSGTIKSRDEKQFNLSLPTGKIELLASSLKILNGTKPLPFELDEPEYGLVAEDVRLKYRYLDLRALKMMDNLVLRSKVVQGFRNHLHNESFLEIETPCLTKGTPEGSREYTVPSRLHPGKSYVLPQSPQQYKQLLMVAGVERYFQVARCFRDEDQRSDRQAEFTQLDLEMSFVDQEDVLIMVEKMFDQVFLLLQARKEIITKLDRYFVQDKTNWPRITYAQAMEQYGTDKPDLRVNKDDPDELAFVWVTDFPMFEKDLDGSIACSHHPFTAPNEQDLEKLSSDPLNVRAQAYDLVLNGAELVSGSVRINRRTLQDQVFRILGLEEEQITERFGHLLEAFEFGAPPHAGCAVGLDRLMMILTNSESIRDVIAFPKTGDARDLMMGAPAVL